MSLTVVITRDVEDRYRGLLASAMLEASAGVYFSNGLSARARDKLWGIVSDWHLQLARGSLTMLFADSASDGGVAVQSLGSPTRRPIRLDGALLMHRVND